MSFFRKKKDDQAAAATAPSGAVAPQPSYGYPGVVAQQQQQYGSPAPSPYPYSQYPAAVAGYQPPAFQSASSQAAAAPPTSSGYQPSALQAYGSVPPSQQQQPSNGPSAAAAMSQQQPQQQLHYGAPPPPVNPHAGSYPGMQAIPQQPSYQPQPAGQPQPQPQSYSYNGYPPASSHPANYSNQPQQAQQQQPQQAHYYHTGYPGAPQQPYSAYTAVRPGIGGAGAAGYATSPSPQPAVVPTDMKPWENTAQASARLARAEASESRVAASPSTGQSAKHKTWAQYQEIEREEREKQQRIQARQQQLQQPQTPTAGAPSPLNQQPLSSDLLSSNAPYHSYPHQPPQQQQQDMPDLLTWNDQAKEQPPTPRAVEAVVDEAGAKGDEEADEDRKEVNGYILRPENEVEEDEEDEEEEEEDDEEEEEDDEVNADEDRKAAQRQHDAQQEGAEGQSWQQIGKGKRQPDEFDTDAHGEGQTKEEAVPVTSLIDYAEKQQESLNQPLLASPANASDDIASFGLIAPVPVPATPIAANFEYAGESRQPSNSVSSSRPATGSGTVVLAASKSKKSKSKKAAAASAAASSAAAMSHLPINAPQQQAASKPKSPAPAAHHFVEPVNPWMAAPNGMAVSPFAQRLYAGFAFQLYTDTSSHDLFLFYEPMDGPRGTLYWCQPGKREKQVQHSMAIHEITHSVLGKHNFPTSNPRAAAAPPIQCFTLYDKTKRLDMCADSGASREEFLKALEEVIKDAPATQVVEAQRAQPAAVATVAVPAVNATSSAATRTQPVPAQVIQSQPAMQMPPQQQQQQQPQHPGYYQPPTTINQPAHQSQQGAAGAAAPWYTQAPFSGYPQLAHQPQQQSYPFAPQYAVPGMSGPAPAAASQAMYAPAASQPLMQPLLQQQQQQPVQGYPAYMQQQQQPQQPPVVMPPPPQVVQENPDLIKSIHAGVGCDVCKVMPIKDVRYKCTLCFNFDICEKCERKGKHTKSHPLIKMYACGRSRDVSELFHRAQYKELQQQQLTKRPGMQSHSLLTEDVRFNEVQSIPLNYHSIHCKTLFCDSVLTIAHFSTVSAWLRSVFPQYHKDMLGRVMAQAHTLPAATMSHLIEILVQLMTATDDSREPFCHIILRDDKTQRLLLPFPVALDILRLCGFDYVQSKQSGDSMSFQGMEQFDELYFNPRYKLTVVETVVERLLRL